MTAPAPTSATVVAVQAAIENATKLHGIAGRARYVATNGGIKNTQDWDSYDQVYQQLEALRYVYARLDMPASTRFFHVNALKPLGLDSAQDHQAILDTSLAIAQQVASVLEPMAVEPDHKKVWNVGKKETRGWDGH